MRSLLGLALIVTLAGLGTSAATAGTLTAATWSQVIYGFPMTRTGTQLGITGSSTSTSLSATLSYPAFATKFFVPKTPNGPDLAVSITQGGPQNLTAAPSMAGATQGVAGTLNVRTAVHNSMGVNQSTFMTGANTLVIVPLSVGVAGQFTGSFIVGLFNHFITVDFYAWTPHTLAFTGLTSKGVALPSVSAMGSFNLTALGGGTVTLVSPSKISIDGLINQRRTVGLTTLKMYFVPEPSTLLLLAAAGAALVLQRTRARN